MIQRKISYIFFLGVILWSLPMMAQEEEDAATVANDTLTVDDMLARYIEAQEKAYEEAKKNVDPCAEINKIVKDLGRCYAYNNCGAIIEVWDCYGYHYDYNLLEEYRRANEERKKIAREEEKAVRKQQRDSIMAVENQKTPEQIQREQEAIKAKEEQKALEDEFLISD